MGEAYRGLTIRFQADGTKVLSTMRAMSRASSNVESELRRLKKALRFDGTNTKAVANQLKLMAESASLTGAEARKLAKELKALESIKVGNKSMRELASETKDVATQTSLLQERANRAAKSIATMHEQLKTAWAGSSKLADQQNPFTRANWEKLSRSQIREYIEVVRQAGAITDAEAKRMSSAIGKLKDEFMAADAAAKNMAKVEAFVSAENKLIELEAHAKALARDLADAALKMRDTGMERTLERAGNEVSRMNSNLRQMKAALEVDPTNLRKIEEYAKAANLKVTALNHENSKLRKEIESLGSENGIRELAQDAYKLQSAMRANEDEIDGLAQSLEAAKARLTFMKNEADETADKMRSAGASMDAISANSKQAAADIQRQERAVERLEASWNQARRMREAYNKANRLNENESRIFANNAEIESLRKAMDEAASEPVRRANEELQETKARLKEAREQVRGIREETEAARASMKALAHELADSMLASPETGFERSMERARNEVSRTKSEMGALNAELKKNPKSFELYAEQARVAKMHVSALRHENEKLLAESRKLGSESGLRELAADSEKLQAGLRESADRVDALAIRAKEAEVRFSDLKAQAKSTATIMKAEGKSADEVAAAVRQWQPEIHGAYEDVKRVKIEMEEAAAAAARFGKAAKLSENSTRIVANNARIAAAESQKQSKKSLLSTSAMTSLGMSMYATVYPMAMMGGSYAIQAAQEVDAAYRDMRKTVQGTETDFENLKRKALEFGDTHVTSADQILEFEAMGGQLGIVSSDLEAFSTTVANLDIATNINADEVAIELGKMASILQISSDEYDNFADSLVRLGNSEPALESDIMNITARFGAMAHIVGMTPDQILAIATAATATGQKAEAAGGSLQRLLGGIETKVSGVSDAMRNLDDLTEEDLAEFEGAKDNLEAFANVAGMSAEQFAQAWEHDAAGAFQSFIEGLKKYGDEGGSVQELLYNQLGYHNIRDLQLLQGLTNTTEVMADSLKMSSNAWNGISDQWGSAGDAAREADKKAQGFSGQLQILKNNGQHMADMLGESLLPFMQQLTGLASDGVKFFENMGDGAKQFTLGLVGLGVASGPALTMMAAVRNAGGSLKKSLSEYAGVEATSARLSNSYIMSQAGLHNQYLKNGKAIEDNKARMSELAREQRKLNMDTQNGIVTSRAYSKEQAKLSKDNAKMQRANRIMAAGSTGIGVLKSVGTMAGFAVGAYVLEQVVSRLIDAKEKAEDFEAATKGVGSIADAIGAMDSSISDGSKNASYEYDNLAVQAQGLREKNQQLTASNADFARSTLASLDEMRGSAIMAEYWGQKIEELSSGFDGSAADLESLKFAVEQYNEVTGSNIQVVDSATGRLNASTDAINANTEAYKRSMEARAYLSVAEEAAKNEADLQVQYELTTQKIDQLREANKRLQEEGKTDSEEYAKNNTLMDQLTKDKQAIEEQIPEMQKARDAALEMADARQHDADVAAEQVEKIREAEQSASAYAEAMKDVGGEDAFADITEHATGSREAVDEFAESLANAGIQGDTLAEMGTEAFNRLYDDCSGDLNAMNELINIFNGMGIDPKTVRINDNGTLTVKDHILDLQNMTIDDKSFTISDDGTISATDKETEALLKEVGVLGKTVAKPTANLTDNASSKISSIASALSSINGRSATVTVNEVTNRVTYTKTVDRGTEKTPKAAGGIDRNILRQIPRHADGMLTGRIVTRATMTNEGLVGEAGAEALLRYGNSTATVPLTNRHYVRPFARAVAAEMPGSTSNQTVNNYYSLNGLTVSAGGAEAQALETLATAMRRRRRG